MEVKNDKTQAERIADRLIELNKDVTKADRKAARETLDLTAETISRYLNGGVQDNDTGASLVEFFKGRIANREKVLNGENKDIASGTELQ